MSSDLMLKDVKRSGLDQKDAATMKLSYMSEERTQTLLKIKAPSYRIPYFDLDGKAQKFFRARLLSPPKGRFGSNQVEKPLRYVQPANTTAHLYFSPLQKDPSWKKISEDINIPLVITEGEKKASAACKVGLPTIGLGGVWSFMSKKLDQELIPDFQMIEWSGREATILFDSDLNENGQVRNAMFTLARRLALQGAFVYIAYLPNAEDGSKQGLDDYLLTHTIEDFEFKLEFEPYVMSRALWDMNEKAAIVKRPGAIYDFNTRQLVKKETFAGVLYAHEFYSMEVNEKLKRFETANEWIKWPLRRTCESVVYQPGAPLITAENSVNSWTGWGCEPKKGDVRIWVKFLDYMFQGDPKLREWFEQWLAYPLQNPGAKLYTSVLIHGLEQGTGKSFIGAIMSRIYGSNYSLITQEDLESTFNEWACNRQFVMGEEITGTDKRRDADRIKNIITREQITVNIKFVPSYQIQDCINYYFTSQHPDAMFVESSDRRFMIHEAPSEKWADENYKALDTWYRGEFGPSALFHYMLHDVDCSKFDPRGRAPNSVAKTYMMDIGLSDIDRFAQMLKTDPDHMLVYDNIKLDGDLFTSSELLKLYDRDGTRKTTLISLGKALRRAGFKHTGTTVTKNGSRQLWPIRNETYWRTASHGKRADHYDNLKTRKTTTGGLLKTNSGKVLKFKRGEKK